VSGPQIDTSPVGCWYKSVHVFLLQKGGCLLGELFDFFLGSLVKGEDVSEFLEWSLGEAALLPEIGGEVSVGVLNGEEGGLHEVTHRLGASLGLGVDVIDTGELEDLLGHTGSNDSRTTGGWYEAHSDGTAFAGNLHGHSVGFTNHVTPISTTHGHDGELGENDSTTDGGGNLLRALDTQPNMTIRVTNNHEGLEAGSLTSAGLFLHWHDFHHLILQLISEEVVYYLIFLDG